MAISSNINILMILADDLGYGDTSVAPFVGTGIKTPELEKMAAKGMVMTNFHSAAATCSPTRASILTGLYPWRVGMKAVFEYGEKGKSNRDDWLPLLPTSAMVFRDNHYFTGHSGKWHLSGMRNDDYNMRKLPVQQSSKGGSGDGNAPGMKRCPHPGPNQQGFDEYVSVLDGPGAPRQNELQVHSTLYSKGCEHLLRNDESIGRAGGPSDELLSDCEARHAVRMMQESHAANKSFFIQLWFHAPHGPWEDIHKHRKLYDEDDKREKAHLPLCSENYAASTCVNSRGNEANKVQRSGRLIDQYKTMVTSMDHAIGTVLRALETMGLERNTLVVFTSDNGPEFVTRGGNAGSAGGLRGAKRSIYEGGVRVPTIVQWVGTIPPGKTDFFGISTDFYPTFLDAASLRPPSNLLLDGVSFLPLLMAGGVVPPQIRRTAKRRCMERVAMWHNDFEGPRASALWIYDFKLVLNGTEYPTELFDMKVDKTESNNLLKGIPKGALDLRQHPYAKKQAGGGVGGGGSGGGGGAFGFALSLTSSKPATPTSAPSEEDMLELFSRSLHDQSLRGDARLHQWIVAHAYPAVRDFARHGNEAHKLYLKENKGREYVPTVESDTRHMVRTSSHRALHPLFLAVCSTRGTGVTGDCHRPLLVFVLFAVPFSLTHRPTSTHLYSPPPSPLTSTHLHSPPLTSTLSTLSTRRYTTPTRAPHPSSPPSTRNSSWAAPAPRPAAATRPR